MSSITNLARKSLLANKSRTCLTALAIIMTTCLLTSIGILTYSIQSMLIGQVAEQTGSIHAEYKNVTDEQVDILKNNIGVEAVSEVLGSDIRVNDERLGSISLAFQYIDNIELAGMTLADGRLPAADDEIVLESWILQKLRIDAKPGERISLAYGIPGQDDRQPFGQSEFKLSGILKDSKYTKNWNASPAIVTKGFILKNTKNVDVLTHNVGARLKSRVNISDAAIELGHKIGIRDENIKINERYIDALAGDMSTMVPYTLVSLVVVFTAGISIYNIFYISVTQRIQQFGLISAVGGTKKQLRRTVLAEGMILSLAGIPVGLLLGYLLSYFIIPMFYYEGLKITVTPWVFLAAALISLLSLILAISKPSRLASGVSPVEAIRYNGSELRSGKVIRKGEKVPGIRLMAWLNLRRNRKRTVITLISLIMSGVLFMVFSTILASMNVQNLTDTYTTGDFQLTSDNINNDLHNDPLNTEMIHSIKMTDGIKELETIMFDWIYLDYQPGKVIPNLPAADIENLKELNCAFYGYEDGFMLKQLEHVSEGKVTLENMKTTNSVLVLAEDNGTSPFKPGEVIRLKKGISENTDEEVEVTVLGIVKKSITWMGMSGIGPTFIAHQNTFNRLSLDERIARVCINVREERYDIVKGMLESVTGSSNNRITFMTQKETNEAFERQIGGIKLAAMSLISIIGIIGILNLINTMITSILSRKKEIGMLQAVGLSDRQLGKMLQLEGACYSVTSAGVSVVAGTILGYIFYTLFKQDATYAQYAFPIWPIVFILVVYTLVQVVITFIIKKNLGKESIINRIRLNE